MSQGTVFLGHLRRIFRASHVHQECKQASDFPFAAMRAIRFTDLEHILTPVLCFPKSGEIRKGVFTQMMQCQNFDVTSETDWTTMFWVSC